MTRRSGPWTIEDTEMLAGMARAGHTDIEIGRRLGVSAFVIGRKRRALGVAAGVPARLRIVLARRALPNGGRKSLL
jgi:hypothetical protein